MEIIYTTPLSKWNPYGLQYHEDKNVATAGGRNGKKEKPFNGTDRKTFYQTPAAFYTGEIDETDPADTSGSSMWSMDPSGKAWEVRASGHNIIMPEIAGVGKMRQRYPIAPFAQEGSLFQKEIDALKDLVMNPQTYKHMFPENQGPNAVPVTPKPTKAPAPTTTTEPVQLDYITPLSDGTAGDGSHSHKITLNLGQVRSFEKGDRRWVTTSEDNGHKHRILLNPVKDQFGNPQLQIDRCDKEKVMYRCADGHTGYLIPI